MVNRIYIVGPVGSGKSTLARRLSKDYGLTCCELDSIVYTPDPESSSGNRKRSEAERDALLHAILAKERWIVEDAGRAYFDIAMQAADSIIHLEPPVSIRKRRIVLRWIKQRLHLEACGYIPGVYMLKLMFKWTRNYENGADGVKERLVRYKAKTSLLRTERDIRRYIHENLQ